MHHYYTKLLCATLSAFLMLFLPHETARAQPEAEKMGFWGFLDRGRQMSVGSRRFPAPWDIEEYDRSCFIVRDNNGQALAYVISRRSREDTQPPTCSRATRQGGLRRILRSCRDCYRSSELPSPRPEMTRPTGQ